MYNILVYDDRSSYVQFEAIKAFKKLGHNVVLDKNSVDNVDFIFCSNDIRGYFSRKNTNTPIITWVSEYPTQTYLWASMQARQADLIFTTDKSLVDDIKKNCNLNNVYFLPLATSYEIKNIKNSHIYPISFGGNTKTEFITMMESQKDPIKKLPISNEKLYELKKHLESNKDYFSNVEKIVSKDNYLKEIFDEIPQNELYLYRRGNLILYLSMILTLNKRIDILNALNWNNHLHLMPKDWREYILNCQYHDGMKYDEMDSFFSNTAINIDINSLHMPTSVNSRLFDIPLCGGFVMTDFREDVLDIFDEDEIVCYFSIDDLKEKVNFYLKHSDLRKKIINRARERILTQHLYIHRIQYIIKMFEELILKSKRFYLK